MLANQPRNILVTGATGSFGMHFIAHALKNYPKLEKLIIFSRDEYKQRKIRQLYPKSEYPELVFVLGDVRDDQSILKASRNVELLIHAAALKQVEIGEDNPSEFIKTNVIGTENVIQAAQENRVGNVILLSTDKAVNPIGTYGATKLCAEKLFLEANRGSKGNFSVLRFGNLLGSRGSVIEYLKDHMNDPEIVLSHEDMVRFAGTGKQMVDALDSLILNMKGGEIVVPKIDTFRLIDLARTIAPTAQFTFSGIRMGERLSEVLIGESESYQKVESKDFYTLLSSFWKGDLHDYLIENEGIVLPQDFSYSTESNTESWQDEALLHLFA